MRLLKECGVPEEEIRFYHKNGDDYAEELLDVNAHWTKFRVLIYTSTVNVGIDFVMDHYDEMFLYITNQSNHGREIKQMMGRIRKLKNRVVHVLSSSKASYVPITAKEIRRDIVTGITLNNKEIETRKLYKAKSMIDQFNIKHHRVQNKYHYYLENSIWTWLTIENIKERNLSEVYHWNMFALMMLNQGFTISDHDGSLRYGQTVCAALGKAHGAWKKALSEEHQTDEIAKYDQYLDVKVTKDELKLMEIRIREGQATADDKGIFYVNHYRNYVKPEYRDQLTGVQIKEVSLDKIRTKQTLTDWTDEHAAANDMKRQRVGQIGNWDLSKRVAIESINTLLEVKSIVEDRTTVIPCARIREKLNAWIAMYPKLKSAFNLKMRPPKDFRGIKSMIDSVLKSSLGLSLKVFNKEHPRNAQGKNEWKYFYKIDAPIEIQTIFDNTVPRSPPNITPSPTDFLSLQQ